MFYLLSYDVSNDKKRTKIYKYLKDQGYHIQKSVFIIRCNKTDQIKVIYEHVFSYISEKSDSILLIPVCQSCLNKLKLVSKQPEFQKEFWII